MRKLHLVESAPGSLTACAQLLRSDPGILVQRAPLGALAKALADREASIVLLEPGNISPEQVAAPDTADRPPLDRVVVVGSGTLDPAWVRGWLRAGAYEVLPSPIDPNELDRTLCRAWSELDSGPTSRAHAPISLQRDRGGFHRLLSHNAVYQRMLEQARACGAHDGPVLIWGEPGSGKDTLAECIHQSSGRGHRAFVRVTALELAELLNNRGVRNGDRDVEQTPRLLRQRLAVAQGGTLMISGLEELSVPAQAALLRRVLHRETSGETSPLPRGLRVMASMRRSLSADVRRGVYRADLYHHLGLEVLHIPPLRERREDIELLAQHALRTWSAARSVASISSEAMHHLRSYDYPCNVSELETIMELALRTERSSVLEAEALPSHVRKGAPADTPAAPEPVWRTLEEVQADHTRQVLEHTRGNRSEAARILGISRTGLLCKIRRYGINTPPATKEAGTSVEFR